MFCSLSMCQTYLLGSRKPPQKLESFLTPYIICIHIFFTPKSQLSTLICQSWSVPHLYRFAKILPNILLKQFYEEPSYNKKAKKITQGDHSSTKRGGGIYSWFFFSIVWFFYGWSWFSLFLSVFLFCFVLVFLTFLVFLVCSCFQFFSGFSFFSFSFFSWSMLGFKKIYLYCFSFFLFFSRIFSRLVLLSTHLKRFSGF